MAMFGNAEANVIKASTFLMQVAGSNSMKSDGDLALINQTLLTNLQSNWMNNKTIEDGNTYDGFKWNPGTWGDSDCKGALAEALNRLDPTKGPILLGLLACADILLQIAKADLGSADPSVKANYIQTGGVVSSTANADEQMGTSTLNTAGQVANQVPGQDQQFLQTAQDLANAILQGIFSSLSGILSSL